MPPTITIPEAVLTLLPEEAQRAIASAQVGPTDDIKTAYCVQCHAHTGPKTPICDRCTMQGLLGAITLLGAKLTAGPLWGENGIPVYIPPGYVPPSATSIEPTSGETSAPDENDEGGAASISEGAETARAELDAAEDKQTPEPDSTR